MLFTQVVGHQYIKQRLIQTVKDNRISHAQLFYGKEGTGALQLAMAYAQFINCTNKQENDSCGTCPSCKKYQNLAHPDLHFAFPIFKKKPSPAKTYCDDFIEDWRELNKQNPYFTLNQWYQLINIQNKQGGIFESESSSIIKKLMLKSFEATYKVMIIWLIEKMNRVSANRLLKLIEEPPPQTLLLLVAEQTGKILPTILSRTAQVFVPEIQNDDLYQVLQNSGNLTPQAISNIVKISGGSFSNAINLIDQEEENDFNFENFVLFVRLAWKHGAEEILKWVDNMALQGREKQKSFLLYGLRLIRDNFMLNLKTPELIRLNEKEEEWSVKFSQFIHAQNIKQISQEFNEAFYHIERNANSKIVLFDLALKIASLLKTPVKN